MNKVKHAVFYIFLILALPYDGSGKTIYNKKLPIIDFLNPSNFISIENNDNTIIILDKKQKSLSSCSVDILSKSSNFNINWIKNSKQRKCFHDIKNVFSIRIKKRDVIVINLDQEINKHYYLFSNNEKLFLEEKEGYLFQVININSTTLVKKKYLKSCCRYSTVDVQPNGFEIGPPLHVSELLQTDLRKYCFLTENEECESGHKPKIVYYQRQDFIPFYLRRGFYSIPLDLNGDGQDEHIDIENIKHIKGGETKIKCNIKAKLLRKSIDSTFISGDLFIFPEGCHENIIGWQVVSTKRHQFLLIQIDIDPVESRYHYTQVYWKQGLQIETHKGYPIDFKSSGEKEYLMKNIFLNYGDDLNRMLFGQKITESSEGLRFERLEFSRKRGVFTSDSQYCDFFFGEQSKIFHYENKHRLKKEFQEFCNQNGKL